MNTPTNIQKRTETSPERVRQRPTVAPLVDVYENRDGLTLYADIPGVPKDAVRVHLDGDQLTIEASRHTEPPKGTLLASEWRPADYHRVFTVSDEIDASKVDAELASGVLRVRLPKSEAKKPRRIEVKAG